jgi:hypothetical protein
LRKKLKPLGVLCGEEEGIFIKRYQPPAECEAGEAISTFDEEIASGKTPLATT